MRGTVIAHGKTLWWMVVEVCWRMWTCPRRSKLGERVFQLDRLVAQLALLQQGSLGG